MTSATQEYHDRRTEPSAILPDVRDLLSRHPEVAWAWASEEVARHLPGAPPSWAVAMALGVLRGDDGEVLL